MIKNAPFCSFASFSIVSLTPFINKLDYSRDLTIFMISPNSLFVNSNVIIIDSKIFLREATTMAGAAAFNLNSIRILLGQSVSKSFINGKPTFIDGPSSLARNPPYCTI